MSKKLINFSSLRWPQISLVLLFDILNLLLGLFLAAFFLKTVLYGPQTTSLAFVKLGWLMAAVFLLIEWWQKHFHLTYVSPKTKKALWLKLIAILFILSILALDLWGAGWKKDLLFSLFGLFLIWVVSRLLIEKAPQK